MSKYYDLLEINKLANNLWLMFMALKKEDYNRIMKYK